MSSIYLQLCQGRKECSYLNLSSHTLAQLTESHGQMEIYGHGLLTNTAHAHAYAVTQYSSQCLSHPLYTCMHAHAHTHTHTHTRSHAHAHRPTATYNPSKHEREQDKKAKKKNKSRQVPMGNGCHLML